MRAFAVFLFFAMVGLSWVPWGGAQLPAPEPWVPPAPDSMAAVPTNESLTCPDPTACVGESSSDEADCDGDTSEWGRNDNATHAVVSDPLVYTMVMAYDQCSTGNWWQEYRGFFIVHHNPALTAAAGGYTLEQGGADRTQYYVLVFTPAGGADVRWTGEERETDEACDASVATNVWGFRIWDNFPCLIPPPQVPESDWGNVIP